MKYAIVIMVLCAAVCSQARTWTNTEGKTLEGEVVRVKDDTVFIKITRTRRIHPIEVSLLSAADQEFIKRYKQKLADRLAAQALKERRLVWHDNFKDAKAEAERSGLPILLLYTAPEWCGYCVRLEDRVFDTGDFKRFAAENLVLLVADFSEKDDRKDWEEDNEAVSSKFKAGGFPCMFFITKDTNKLGRIGGYEEDWSTDDYLEKMEAIIRK